MGLTIQWFYSFPRRKKGLEVFVHNRYGVNVYRMVSSKCLLAAYDLKGSTGSFFAVNRLNVITSRSWRAVELLIILLPNPDIFFYLSFPWNYFKSIFFLRVNILRYIVSLHRFMKRWTHWSITFIGCTGITVWLIVIPWYHYHCH